jgi:uncharacterized protein (DUF58 family)
MFTRKSALYFSLAVAMLSIGLLLQDFQLGILSLGLASLFFLANVWGLPETVNVALSRHIVPDETFGNDDITIEQGVENAGKSSLANVEILEVIPGKIHPKKGTNYTVTSLRAFEKQDFKFEFDSPTRGNYQIGPLIVRARDPYGFYLVEKKLEPETLSVIPRPERIRGAQLRPRHVLPWPGPIESRSMGIGTEFYSLREYVPGDDPKRINWKASARQNELIVNETEAERVTDVMVVLDTDVTIFEEAEAELFERGVQAAASIASLLLRQGNRVGLVLQGRERGSLPAGFGKRHERRILYLLAEAKPGRPTVSTSYVMNLLARRMLPSRAQIIIISSLLEPEMKEGVNQLVQAGYNMLVLSPRPTPPSKPVAETERIGFNLAMLERSITLLALEKYSTVVDWPREMSFSAILSKVSKRRAIVVA